MVKKNKRQEEGLSVTTCILMILGLVVLVVLIFGFTLGWEDFLDSFNEQEFGITKEECSNSLIIEQENLFCKASCLYGLVTALMDLDENITTEYERIGMNKKCESFCDEKIPIEKVCKQVEVDKIEIERIPENQEACIESAIIDVRDCPIGEPNSDECIQGVCHEFLIMEKRYLSIEWLDENAECIEAVSYYYENGKKISGKIEYNETYAGGIYGYIKNLNENCFKGDEDSCKQLESAKCSEYKLGDYNVRVS